MTILSKFDLPNSYCLWYYEDLEEKADWLTDWLNQSINDEADCRTAPATPDPLKTKKNKHATPDKGHISALQLLRFGIYTVLEDSERKEHSLKMND